MAKKKRKKQRTASGALAPMQRRFVEHYLIKPNATEAAIKAGYSESSAESQGSRLLSNAKVRKAIQEAEAERLERVQVKQDDVLRELMRVGLSDIRQAFDEGGRLLPVNELPEEIARAIAGVEVEQLFAGSGRDRYEAGVTVKVKLWPKVPALELLGKHLALFTENINVAGKGGGPIQAKVQAEVKNGQQPVDGSRLSAVAALLAAVGALPALGGAEEAGGAPVPAADGVHPSPAARDSGGVPPPRAP